MKKSYIQSLQKIKQRIIAFFDFIGSINIINKYSERIVIALGVLCFVILIVSQIGLGNEATRTFFTNIEKYEGVGVKDIGNVFKEGELTLQLIGTQPSENIKVLLNGNQDSAFTSESIRIKVRNNSVVEIDGSKVKTPFRVKVIGQSENISGTYVDNEIEIKSNISILTRIFLK